MAEARRIIDAGNVDGVVLRLTGGLAVRHYAIDLEFAEREYSDIDLVGRRRETAGVIALFTHLGCSAGACAPASASACAGTTRSTSGRAGGPTRRRPS